MQVRKKDVRASLPGRLVRQKNNSRVNLE